MRCADCAEWGKKPAQFGGDHFTQPGCKWKPVGVWQHAHDDICLAFKPLEAAVERGRKEE